MLSARQLLGAVGVAIIAVACVDRITYVDRAVPTPGPLRVDTVVVTRPETTFTQLPGRVDTVVTRTPPETSYVQLPPRVDTVVTVRPETLVVTVHDTVIKRDTVIHVDTVVLDHRVASICLYLRSADGDTLYLQREAAINACAPQLMAAHFPGVKVVGLFDTLKMILPSSATASRSSHILPNWRATH